MSAKYLIFVATTSNNVSRADGAAERSCRRAFSAPQIATCDHTRDVGPFTRRYNGSRDQTVDESIRCRLKINQSMNLTQNGVEGQGAMVRRNLLVQ